MMMHVLKFYLILVTAFLSQNCCESSSFIDPTSSSLSSSLEFDFSSPEIFNILKDELQHLKMDLTKSFLEGHSRRKRETSSSGQFTYKVAFASSHSSSTSNAEETFSKKIENIGHSTTIFKNSIIIFQKDGIYRLERHSASSSLQLVKFSDWQLKSGDRILASSEWEEKLFVLTTNKDDGTCHLYTLVGDDANNSKLISRQTIKNQGFATTAQFFAHGNEYYLAITVDNAAHSLTISPIFRWVHTYMDQIHEVQTRGASAVETFTIGSFKYIALAQTQDADNNKEVGTLLVRMFPSGHVERFQLLWSNQPMSLKYVQFLKEDFLVIGQPKESLVYWFGGYDFLHWQSLEGFNGCVGRTTCKIFLDSFTWQGEPILLVGNEKEISFYTRSSSETTGSTQLISSKLVKTSTIYKTKSEEDIVGVKILYESKTIFSLALSIHPSSSSSNVELLVRPLEINSEEIPASQVREPEDNLSQCFITLGNLLSRDEPALELFETDGYKILRKDEALTYTGKITSLNEIRVNEGNLGTLSVVPDFEDAADIYANTPSDTLASIQKYTRDFDGTIGAKLKNVVRKSEEGEISGALTFTKPLKIQSLNSASKLDIRTINGIHWDTLKNKVLRSNSEKTQIITGDWKVENLIVNEVLLKSGIEKDFLLTSCPKHDEAQRITGRYHFKRDMKFTKNLVVNEDAFINDIRYSDIALRNSNIPVEGYKHANTISGGENLKIEKWNNERISEWYESLLRISGTEKQIAHGFLNFTNELSCHKLQVDLLNGKEWDAFLNSVMLDAGDQTIESDINCDNLKVAHLYTETINDKEMSDLLSTTSNQHITSEFTVAHLRLKKNLNSLKEKATHYTINGIHLRDAVLKTENAIISGPIGFRGQIAFGDIKVTEGVTIGGHDISEIAKLRKKHIYSTLDSDQPIHLKGDVSAHNLHSDSWNGAAYDSISSAYWSSLSPNEISNDFDFSSASTVNVNAEFTTRTLNGLNLEHDVITTTKNGEIVDSAKLDFTRPVTVFGDVITPDGIALNEIDFSEFFKQIVRTSEVGRKIHGKKIFQDDVDAEGGIRVKKINELSLEDDVVFLSSTPSLQHAQEEEILDLKHFEELVAHDVIAETDAEVGGTVNGWKLKELEKNTVYSDGEAKTISSDLVFTENVETEDLHAIEINGIKVHEILSHVINLNEAHPHLDIQLAINEGSLIFEDDAKVLYINAVLTHEYLSKIVDKSKARQIINGTKEFHNLSIEKDLECTTINDINLKEIEEFGLSKTAEQTISGKYFLQEAQIENLITEKIDGIPISQFVQTDKENLITTPVIFENNAVIDSDLTIDGLLNGYHIEKMHGDLKILKGSRQFDKITVTGNLTWRISHEKLKRFSYLLEHAVTTNTPQTFTEQITFEHGLSAVSIDSDKWINNVNLKAIELDSVDVKEENLVFQGDNIFTGQVRVTLGSLDAVQLDTLEVNGISLARLDQQVVRKNSEISVTGTKTFVGGFSTHELHVQDTIDNIHVKDLVTIKDRKTIDFIDFALIDIIEDLNFRSLEGLDLTKLLAERITKQGSHQITGDVTFENDVIVEDCKVDSINGVKINDIFLANSEKVQTVTGTKKFSKLIIESDLHNTKINGFDFEKINSQILRRDKNETILRPVVFVDTVLISNSVEVTKTINDIDFQDVTDAFAEKLEQIKDTVTVDETKIANAEALIVDLEKNLQIIPGWFNHLVFGQDLNSAQRVEYSADKNDLTIFMHKQIDGTKCGLPLGCSARSIEFLNVKHDSLLSTSVGHLDCFGVFEVTVPSGSTYLIYNEIASSNENCTKKESGQTTIFHADTALARVNNFNIHSITEGPGAFADFPKQKFTIGFISDVKSFSSRGVDYLVIGQLYHHLKRTQDTGTLVYKVVNGELEIAQEIESHGPLRLSIDNVGGQWILGILNTKSPTSSCHVHASIYFWNAKNSQFELIRSIETTNPTDIISLTAANGENFIAISEQEDTLEMGEEHLGKISIYRYDKQRLSYTLFQVVDSKIPVTALSMLNTKEFSYLVYVTKEGLNFLQCLHVEGFILKLTVPLKGAQDTNGIMWKDEIFFPIAGAQSILAKGKYSGRITNSVNLD